MFKMNLRGSTFMRNIPFKKYIIMASLILILVLISVLPVYANTLCTWDPSNLNSGTSLSNGNLTIENFDNLYGNRATSGVSSGKWYWELTLDSDSYTIYGVANSAAPLPWINNGAYGNNARIFCSYAGLKFPGRINYGSDTSSGDVVGIALDVTDGELTVYKNGVSEGVAFTDISLLGKVYPFIINGSSSADNITTANFGAKAFKYAIPTGYLPYNSSIINTPSTPSNLIASNIGTTAVELSWSADADDIAYRIYENSVLLGTSTTTTYTVSSLQQSTDYWFTVSGYDTPLESTQSLPLLTTTSQQVNSIDSNSRTLKSPLILTDGINYYDTATKQIYPISNIYGMSVVSNATELGGAIKAKASVILFMH